MSLTQPLSESINGQPIEIVQGATPGDLLHVGKRGKVEMVRLVVSNRSAGALVFVIEWGTPAAGQSLEISLAANSIVELPEMPFTGGPDTANLQEIRAFCATPNELAVVGEVRTL